MRKTRMSKKKSSKNNLLIAFTVFMTILLGTACGYGIYHYNYIKYWDELIYPGVTVEGINLSEKTKEESKSIISQSFSQQINKKNINVKAEGQTYTLSYSKINPKYDVEDAINKALSYGKNSNILKKYILLKNPKNENFKLKFSYDSKPVKEIIKNVESKINKDPEDASLDFSTGKFNISHETNGKKVEKDKLEKEILSKINGNIGEDNNIDAPIQVLNPRIKGDMLKNVSTVIGSYSTNYGSISSPERANNITLATKSINGKILMPGDIFSFNDVVGERTAKKGYQGATVIVGNKFESGIGGGVCQTSSTLYNAVFRAGIPALERSHHTMPVHYVPQGMDATVDYGNIDYKFKNIYSYPIYIQAYTAAGNVVFNLYSNSTIRN